MNKLFNSLKLIVAIIAFFGIQGCYTYDVTAHKAPIGTFSDNPHAKHTTYWSYFWGFKQPNIPEPPCHGNGLATLTVKTNYAYVALSFVTLGIVTPIQINWQCSKCPKVN